MTTFTHVTHLSKICRSFTDRDFPVLRHVQVTPAAATSTAGAGLSCDKVSLASRATLGIRTRESSQDDGLDTLHCTAHISTKSLHTAAAHLFKTNCLLSGHVLEFVLSATTMERHRKGSAAIKQSTLNMSINKTQDTSDKTLLSFPRS